MNQDFVLQVLHLRRSFQNGKTPFWAVDDISFSVERGSIAALLGPNGAGKTTTVQMIAGYLAPTSGQILVCGNDCACSREKIRRKIGVVFGGELGFYGRATAWENLMFFAALADLGKRRRQEAERVLKAVSLWEAAHQRVGTFSRGMRQRLHIARALLGHPELLLLDEPTNGIDVELAHELRVLIRRLADDGAAVLLTSHSMSEIEHLADRILLIGAGKLVHDGDLESVRKLSHVTHIDRPATLEESYLALSPMLRRE